MGTAWTHEQVAPLSAVIDLAALRAYWQAVGERTAAAVRSLQLEHFKASIANDRLLRTAPDGAHANPRRADVGDGSLTLSVFGSSQRRIYYGRLSTRPAEGV